jgi:hypothetical protein
MELYFNILNFMEDTRQLKIIVSHNEYTWINYTLQKVSAESLTLCFMSEGSQIEISDRKLSI